MGETRGGDSGSEGQRFQFGENWRRFLKLVDDDRISVAVQSLRDMLGVDSLEGQTFLDVGSGSGLFSLAARRLGARVRSFDYDPASVACTREMRRRFASDDPDWIIEQGSVLDEQYLHAVGTFDVVYSWGVLHHTGDLWRAMSNVTSLVRDGGRLYIAIYNDQGEASRRWTAVKRKYNESGAVVRNALIGAVGAFFALRKVGKQIRAGKVSLAPATVAKSYSDRGRGMSVWFDLRDWVGGYPFEVAKPEQVLDFCRPRGFELLRLRTAGGGHACNEYVFARRG